MNKNKQEHKLHEICINSRACINCAEIIGPNFGICFSCHENSKKTKPFEVNEDKEYEPELYLSHKEIKRTKCWCEDCKLALSEAINQTMTTNDNFGNPNKLIDCTDAQIWAQEFMRVIIDNNIKIDEAQMIGWFANAIESGRSACIRQVKDKIIGTIKFL